MGLWSAVFASIFSIAYDIGQIAVLFRRKLQTLRMSLGPYGGSA